jgi:hypothetical protein
LSYRRLPDTSQYAAVDARRLENEREPPICAEYGSMPVAMLAVRVETHFPGLDVSRRICPTSRTRGLHPGFTAQEWPEEAKGGRDGFQTAAKQ